MSYRHTPIAATCSWETPRPPLAGKHRRQSGPPRAVLAPAGKAQTHSACSQTTKTVWPSGLRRWLKAPVRKGVLSFFGGIDLPNKV